MSKEAIKDLELDLMVLDYELSQARSFKARLGIIKLIGIVKSWLEVLQSEESSPPRGRAVRNERK